MAAIIPIGLILLIFVYVGAALLAESLWELKNGNRSSFNTKFVIAVMLLFILGSIVVFFASHAI